MRTDGRITYQMHDRSEPEDSPLSTGPRSLEFIKKYQASVLGEHREVKNEKRKGLINKKHNSKNKKEVA